MLPIDDNLFHLAVSPRRALPDLAERNESVLRRGWMRPWFPVVDAYGMGLQRDLNSDFLALDPVMAALASGAPS